MATALAPAADRVVLAVIADPSAGAARGEPGSPGEVTAVGVAMAPAPCSHRGGESTRFIQLSGFRYIRKALRFLVGHAYSDRPGAPRCGCLRASKDHRCKAGRTSRSDRLLCGGHTRTCRTPGRHIWASSDTGRAPALVCEAELDLCRCLQRVQK